MTAKAKSKPRQPVLHPNVAAVAHKEDPAAYGTPDERQVPRMRRGETRGVTVPRHTELGGSMGFDGSMPGVVQVEDWETKTVCEIDLQQLRDGDIERAMEQTADLREVFASLSKIAPPSVELQTVEAAPSEESTPAVPGYLVPPASATKRQTSGPVRIRSLSVGDATHMARPAPQITERASPQQTTSDNGAPAAQAQGEETVTVKLGDLRRLVSEGVIGSWAQEGPQQLITQQSVRIPVPVNDQDPRTPGIVAEAVAGCGVVQQAAGPPPTCERPKFQVDFRMLFGGVSTRYHDILEANGNLVLVYDTRYEDGVRYTPQSNPEKEFEVHVPALKSTYTVFYGGQQFQWREFEFTILPISAGGG